MQPHDGLLVAIGLKQKGTQPGMPPSVRDQMMPRKSDATPTPEAEPTAGMKASPDDAGLVPPEQHCHGCVNWERDTQSCSKVEGSMTGDAGCRKFFAPLSGGGIPTLAKPNVDETKGLNASPLGQ